MALTRARTCTSALTQVRTHPQTKPAAEASSSRQFAQSFFVAEGLILSETRCEERDREGCQNVHQSLTHRNAESFSVLVNLMVLIWLEVMT